MAGRILVLDDEENYAEMLQDLLREHDYRVDMATRPEWAIAQLEDGWHVAGGRQEGRDDTCPPESTRGVDREEDSRPRQEEARGCREHGVAVAAAPEHGRHDEGQHQSGTCALRILSSRVDRAASHWQCGARRAGPEGHAAPHQAHPDPVAV